MYGDDDGDVDDGIYVVLEASWSWLRGCRMGP
jgi:hypothetical protein